MKLKEMLSCLCWCQKEDPDAKYSFCKVCGEIESFGFQGLKKQGNNTDYVESCVVNLAKTGVVSGVAGVAVPTAATAGLTAAGFTGSGIAAGSLAAGFQAGVGNIAAGSLFATFQSIGATGGFAVLGPVGAGAALLCGGVFLGKKLWNGIKKVVEEEELEKLRRNNALKEVERVKRLLCPKCRQKLEKSVQIWLKK